MHYDSRIGRKDLFWLQDQTTRAWILGQQSYFKNGKPKTTWKERIFIPAPPEDITEEDLFAVFSQAENDLTFRDAAGEKSGIVNNGNLRGYLDGFAQKRPVQ
jgi:hypothetical protein